MIVKAKIAALLPAKQDQFAKDVASRPLTEQPYWSIERARIGVTRKVAAELIINGVATDTMEVDADGLWKDIVFSTTQLSRSSWVAIRILPAAHTNPVFVIVDNKPIREKASLEWAMSVVDQCWKMKKDNIRENERAAAEKAYSKAREIYAARLKEIK